MHFLSKRRFKYAIKRYPLTAFLIYATVHPPEQYASNMLKNMWRESKPAVRTSIYTLYYKGRCFTFANNEKHIIL